METRKIEINYQGEILRGYMDLPDGFLDNNSKISVVIQFHGMCGQCDSKIDLALAQYFTSKNMCVVRVNFLGHGDSEGDFFKVTVPGQLPQAEEILRYVKNLPFVGEISLVGHSMGAIAATMLAGKYPNEIERVILLAPAFIIEKLCQTGEFGDFSYDPQYPPEKVGIPGTRFLFSREYLVTGKDINIMGWASKFPGPVCVIHGDADDFLPVNIIAPYVKGFPQGEMKIVEGGSHFFGGTKTQMIACVDEFFHDML
ncbi:MAG: alpha/beta hydrolase [Eubacteriales bacterium]|nr:alpha/beta hydrolase [Eubacteriales bacterium]